MSHITMVSQDYGNLKPNDLQVELYIPESRRVSKFSYEIKSGQNGKRNCSLYVYIPKHGHEPAQL